MQSAMETMRTNINLLEIWIIELPKFFNREEYYFSLLNRDEKKRAQSLISKEHTSRYTISQGILRCILANHLSCSPKEISFTFGSHKKPYLAENSQKIFFNLSHSHNAALIGISLNDEIGVDIEKLNPQTLEIELEKNIFSETELHTYLTTPPEKKAEAFFAGWTHKEAILKLAGIGLYKDLQELEVPLHLLTQTTPVLFEGSTKYLRSFYALPNYIGAVASPKPNFNILFQTFNP